MDVLPRPGERWVVRHRLPDGRATDVTGWVETVDASAWRLLPAGRTETVSVDPGTVVAARRVPAAPGAPPPERTSAADLERIAARGWVADHEPLGAWTLRAAGGFTHRANSCLAVGDPGVAYAVAAERIVAYAARRGIAPLAQVNANSAEETELRGLGWRPGATGADVLAVRLADLLVASRDRPDPRVEIAAHPGDDWRRAFDRSRPWDGDPGVVDRLLAGSPDHAYATLPAPDGAAAVGRGHLGADWVGISCVWTDPPHRGQGLATAVVAGLGHWAARRGARWAYLQVASGNTRAHDAYARLGFTLHHRYGYLGPPDPRPPETPPANRVS